MQELFVTQPPADGTVAWSRLSTTSEKQTGEGRTVCDEGPSPPRPARTLATTRPFAQTRTRRRFDREVWRQAVELTRAPLAIPQPSGARLVGISPAPISLRHRAVSRTTPTSDAATAVQSRERWPAFTRSRVSKAFVLSFVAMLVVHRLSRRTSRPASRRGRSLQAASRSVTGRWYGSGPRHDLRAGLTCQDARLAARYRTALPVACMVLAMLTAGACQQVNEALSDRDLECGTVREGICTRLADHIASDFERLNPTVRADVTVTVTPVVRSGHEEDDPAMARCWLVDAQTSPPPGTTGGAGSRRVLLPARRQHAGRSGRPAGRKLTRSKSRIGDGG